eukprot:751373-Hanusia_phi.AAC.2
MKLNVFMSNTLSAPVSLSTECSTGILRTQARPAASDSAARLRARAHWASQTVPKFLGTSPDDPGRISSIISYGSQC